MTTAAKTIRQWFNAKNIKDNIEGNKKTVHVFREDGNSVLTRGAFGEITIGLVVTDLNDCLDSSDDDNTRKKFSNYRGEWVVLKTLDRVTTYSNGHPQQQQHPQDAKLTRPIFQELTALQMLQSHPNIIPLLDIIIPNTTMSDSLSLVFPYCPVDLHFALQYRQRKYYLQHDVLDFEIVQTILYDLCCALQHVHDTHSLVHGDIKPGNLLVTNNGTIQLCDFGLAKPQQTLQGNIGSNSNDNVDKAMCTLFYRSPELLLGATPSSHPSMDMYSAGLILAELLNTNHQPLFQGTNVVGQIVLVLSVLGTPLLSSSTTTTNAEYWQSLPDYDKLNYFIPRDDSNNGKDDNNNNNNNSSNKKGRLPKSWMDIIPRSVECKGMTELLSGLVSLHPQDRWTAAQVLEYYSQQTHGSFIEKPTNVIRHELRKTLIPPALQPPILLSSNDKDHLVTTAKENALNLAKRRRNLLNGTLQWPSTSSSFLEIKTMEELAQKYQ